MKTAILVVFSISSASWAFARQEPGPPVDVLKYQWAFTHHQNDDSFGGAPFPPTGIPNDHDPSRVRLRPVRALIPPPTNMLDDEEQKPLPRQDVYQYTLALRNLSERSILEVVWEYIIVDPRSHAELARLRFTTARKIKSGKSKSLSGFTRTPPTCTASVQSLRHETGPGIGEFVEIRRIRYSDGTEWVRP